MRWLYAVLVGAVLTGFAFLLVTGHYINDGPVLLSVTSRHGLHTGDVLVLLGWGLAMAALALLARSPGRAR